MSKNHYFIYGNTEKDWLKSRDPKLGRVIDQVGHIQRQVRPDLFSALINSIVGQQISTKAQVTVWGRFRENLLDITPETIRNTPVETLQSFGITMRKAEYIKGVANSVFDNTLDLDNLHNLSDHEIFKELSALKGVGIWTAEMLMIFSMERPNILS